MYTTTLLCILVLVNFKAGMQEAPKAAGIHFRQGSFPH